MSSGITVFDLPPVGQIGRYDILGRYAEGGMAEIFLAREQTAQGSSRPVAIKRMRPDIAKDDDIREMFEQEARLCMGLRHPNICTIYEFGKDGDVPFMAMEWIHGVPLSDLIESMPGTLPLAVVAKIFADVASGLSAAHTAKSPDGSPLGIVHRDVTPHNIMVGFDGVVRLVDFGIAKAAVQRSKTQTGVVKGKFAYMSPEQFAGAGVDTRTDIFALGVCLYEALTGVPLFERDTQAETMSAIVMGHTLPSMNDLREEVPEELDAIYRTAAARAADDRYATASAMQHAFLQFLATRQRVVSDDDVRSVLQQAFPRLSQAAPVVDRQSWAQPETDGPKSVLERSSVEAELDELGEALEARSRRKGRAIVVLAILVVLGTLAAVGFAAISTSG